MILQAFRMEWKKNCHFTKERIGRMYQEYKSLFDSYYEICKAGEAETMDTIELESSCITCDVLKNQLIGMLDLLLKCGEIQEEVRDFEFNRIIERFSTVKLYHAYLEPGTGIVIRKWRNRI